MPIGTKQVICIFDLFSRLFRRFCFFTVMTMEYFCDKMKILLFFKLFKIVFKRQI